MKYIRTKDGRIFDISSLLQFIKTDKPYVGEGIGTFQGVPIVKEADTIEELCDMFVAFDGDKEKGPIPFIRKEKSEWHYILKMLTPLSHSIGLDFWLKLANWTDKGLIYVAKLTDKGEWELL